MKIQCYILLKPNSGGIYEDKCTKIHCMDYFSCDWRSWYSGRDSHNTSFNSLCFLAGCNWFCAACSRNINQRNVILAFTTYAFGKKKIGFFIITIAKIEGIL